MEQGLARMLVVHTQLGVGLSTADDDLRRKDEARLGCSVEFKEKSKIELC